MSLRGPAIGEAQHVANCAVKSAHGMEDRLAPAASHPLRMKFVRMALAFPLRLSFKLLYMLRAVKIVSAGKKIGVFVSLPSSDV